MAEARDAEQIQTSARKPSSSSLGRNLSDLPHQIRARSSGRRSRPLSPTAGYLLLAVLGPSGCAVMPGADSAKIGRTSVSYALTNRVPPTAVFEAGLGNGKQTWRGLAGRLSAQTSVFAYSRPGNSGSGRFGALDSDADGKRTGLEVATRLRAQEAYATAQNARYVEASRSGHHAHRDRPELVSREILRLVDAARVAQSGPDAGARMRGR